MWFLDTGKENSTIVDKKVSWSYLDEALLSNSKADGDKIIKLAETPILLSG